MIYLDNASTTRCFDEVNKFMFDANQTLFFNPSSLHSFGFDVHKKIEDVRWLVLSSICGANCGRLIFTSSATEANNSVFFNIKKNVKKIIVGAGEHPSVLENAKQLANKGILVLFAPLNSNGEVDIAKFQQMMDTDVGFVSVQMVNNEVGAVNNIEEICKIAKDCNPNCIVHCDAVQGFCKMNIDVSQMNVDFLTISSHKICGPKGVGALYVKNFISFNPFIVGGGQEKNLRSGTENVAGILGFGVAIKKYLEGQAIYYKNAMNMRKKLLLELDNNNVKYRVNGNGSPYVLSLSLSNVRGETMVHALEKYDIAISTGSACSSKKVGNHVLDAMGLDGNAILHNIRISFGVDKLDDATICFVAKTIGNEIVNLGV